MQHLWLRILVFTSSFIIIYCDQESMLIQKYPAEYEQYLQSITEQNNVEGPIVNEKLSDEQPQAGPGSNFVQWLQILLGITTTTAVPITSAKPPTDCEPCTVCGSAVNGTKIVGGTETIRNQYPWMAMLLYSNRFYCGATLITDMHVLTAAHCVSGFNPQRISVRLLEHDRSDPNDTTTITRNVEKITKHPRYSQSTFDNDIAIIKLDKRVKFEGILNPVCMPTKGEWYTGRDGIVAGWGTLKEGGDVSNTLQHVAVPIISNAACRRTGYAPTRITDNMMCAGFKEGQKDSCQGDSGGPLVVADETTNVHQLVGVVSWGEGCAKKNYPGVYARVNRYGTWINQNTIDSCKCSPAA